MRSAIECFSDLKERLNSKAPAVFLDYDGTLTPIVEDPADAFISEEMKGVLERAKCKFPVGIISGRDLDDLLCRVGIDGISYAGSHGLEILFTDGMRKASGIGLGDPLHEVEAAEEEMRALAKRYEGAKVERKRFGVALHYRLVNKTRVGDLREAFEKIASKHPLLRRSEGKMVVELLAGIGANKGTALSEIMDHDGISEKTHLIIFIGDDITDEDAFRSIRGKGIGVIVGDPPESTEAEYYLRGHKEVLEFLERLVGEV